ncbi:hypothetical protein R3P38DRAFT_1115004 [Favolaschia claudopus]|uniref:BTB domain-containing protein n=1 Tax=Favolaschia claudopus TaxID=2862362 RepID=A0AAW0B970_9AGAR
MTWAEAFPSTPFCPHIRVWIYLNLLMEYISWDKTIQTFGDMDYSPTTTKSGGHLPTPPRSINDSPPANTGKLNLNPDAETILSISTTFFSNAHHRARQPDIALLSTDSVYFYVHSDVLLKASNNQFRGIIPTKILRDEDEEQPVFAVPESSSVLNVLLHAIYELSCAHYAPPFDTLVAAVEAMPVYGVDVKATIKPSAPLFNLLLSQAPLFPFQLYALAAQHDLFDLAVPTSSHLLAVPLSRLTDELAERMGAVYLKRLLFLHSGRTEALKRILGAAPHPHPPTANCDFPAQKSVGRAWALATAYLMWDIRPDLSTRTLDSALRPLGEHLACEDCKNALGQRVKNLVVEWSMVKRTI